MNMRSRNIITAGCLAAVLVAAACSDSGDDQVATLTDSGPPPAEASESPPPQAEPAPAPAPVETAPDPVEPAPPAAPVEPAPAAVEPAPPPAASPGPVSASQVADLVAAARAAQEPVTSVEYQVYLTVDINIGGVQEGSISEAPLGLVRIVGPLTWLRYDLATVAEAAFGAGPTPSEVADMAPLEFVIDDTTGRLYAKVDPLMAAGALGEAPDWVAEALADAGGDAEDLWIDSADTGGEFDLLDDLPSPPRLSEFLDLAEAAVAGGAVLEAEHLGPDEVAGVAVEAYRLEVDLALLAGELPALLGEVFGEDVGDPGAGADLLAEMLPGSLPAELQAAVDAAGAARRLWLTVDLGQMMQAIFGAFGEMGADGDSGDVPEMPEMRYVFGTGFEVVALNDPALTVPLPDASQIIGGG